MKTRNFLLILAMMLFGITVSVNAQDAEIEKSGTWGGIDWTLTTDGTLTIAPTKGEPVQESNANGKFTYTVGQWREAVGYNTNGVGASISGWPYDRTKVKKLIIEEGVTSIGSFAVQEFKNLTGEVIIPWTVNYIGQEAFQKSTMNKLTFQKVPEGKEGQELCIAQGAFKNLVIEECALPDDRPVHIHAWLFLNSTKLKHITFPATLTGMTGTNHVDYNHSPNAQTGGNSGSCTILDHSNTSLETITFGSEEVKSMYYEKDKNFMGNMVAETGLSSCLKLQAAIDYAEDGATIKVLKDVTLSEPLIIPEGKDITINLNGKTIKQTQNKELTEDYNMIENYGYLTIVDNSQEQNGKISYTSRLLGG